MVIFGANLPATGTLHCRVTPPRPAVAVVAAVLCAVLFGKTSVVRERGRHGGPASSDDDASSSSSSSSLKAPDSLDRSGSSGSDLRRGSEVHSSSSRRSSSSSNDRMRRTRQEEQVRVRVGFSAVNARVLVQVG